jgi:heat shock protein HslJ/uncharacterized membrane protein
MTIIRKVPAAAGMLLLLGVAAGAGDAPFRAQGNEPFWSLRKTDDAITFQPMGADMVTIAPVPDPTTEGDAEVFRADVEGETFVLGVASRVCTDTMSGMPFPKTVAVELGADSFAGCGGEPVSLLLGTWKVTAIDGEPPLPDTDPSISFDEDGKVGGAASCNRFFGTFTLTGEGLSFGPMGASMMMCDEPVMAQERAVLDILESTTGFAVADDGSLTLNGGDGRTISASRTDDP